MEEARQGKPPPKQKRNVLRQLAEDVWIFAAIYQTASRVGLGF